MGMPNCATPGPRAPLRPPSFSTVIASAGPFVYLVPMSMNRRAAASARAGRLDAGGEVLPRGAQRQRPRRNGFTALHHAAARGDNETIQYLVSRGADVMTVNRAGQTTVDMANSPEQRTRPFPATIALLEGLGAKTNHNCRACK
jgi:hypothetical protein